MAIRTLWCDAGQHKWERESQRGRQPINCPDHKEVVVKTKDQLNPLDKARQVKQERKNTAWQMLKEEAQSVLDDPKMDPRGFYGPADGRYATVGRINYIIDAIDNKGSRLPHEITDLENMLKRILKNPFSSAGHLL